MLSEQKWFVNEEIKLLKVTVIFVVFFFNMKLLEQSIQVERKGEKNIH